jgi:hypothetical protein
MLNKFAEYDDSFAVLNVELHTKKNIEAGSSLLRGVTKNKN